MGTPHDQGAAHASIFAPTQPTFGKKGHGLFGACSRVSIKGVSVSAYLISFWIKCLVLAWWVCAD